MSATLPHSPTVARVVRGELCSGCGLCAGVSGGTIRLGMVAPGYARPHQEGPISRDAEAKIAAACPGARVAPWAEEPEPDPYWGPIRNLYTGHAADPAVRHAGSSGGALAALAIEILDMGAAEAILHVHADPDRPTGNVIRLSRTPAEIIEGTGSRYAASSPLAQIDEMLDGGERFAFIGKPCDVSALRLLGDHDPRVKARVPFMLSFFCGGIPSSAGANRIIGAMGLEHERVSAFRYRGNGWPGRAVASTVDGEVRDMSYEESWGGFLSKEVQFRCKICPDAVGGVADIAAADAWYGGESGYPQFDEQPGRSLIVTRTAEGDELLNRAVARERIKVETLPLREIDLMQPSQARRKRLVAARLAACAATGQPRPVTRGLSVLRAASKAGLAETGRNFLGTIRRIVIGRR